MNDHPPSARERILKAARNLFFANGFAGVSTDRIAREASVSKRSIYQFHDSMADLFTDVVEREVDGFDAGPSSTFDTCEEFADCLTAYGTNILVFLNRPDSLAFSRLMAEEARAHPQIARRFYDAAYGRTLRVLARMFSDAQTKAIVSSKADPNAMAEAYLGALEGMGLVRAHHGVVNEPYPNPKAIAQRTTRMILATDL